MSTEKSNLSINFIDAKNMHIGAFFSLIVGIQEGDEELVTAAFRR